MLKQIKIGAMVTSLNPYKAMPKQDKTPQGYSLTLDGKEVKHPAVALTGGGAHPAYTYLNMDGNITWFAGHIASGTAVETVTPVKAEAKPEQPQAPAQADAKPAKGKK